MSAIKLTLDSIETTIRIGQSIDAIRDTFTDIETIDTYSEDLELKRHSLCYRTYGIEFIFNAKILTAVFIYIKDENFIPFKGTFGCLNEDFFLKANIQQFYNLTLADNFVEWFKDYPMSTDMVKDGLRLRFKDNNKMPSNRISYTNLTMLLRKTKLPLHKQDLLPKMMQRFENAILAHKLNRLDEADYKKNCIRLINQLNEI